MSLHTFIFKNPPFWIKLNFYFKDEFYAIDGVPGEKGKNSYGCENGEDPIILLTDIFLFN